MLVEKILISKGGDEEIKVSIHTLIIPDVRILSLCLDKEDGNLLLWCYDQGELLHNRIKSRKENHKIIKHLNYDVPDLWFIAKKFQRVDGEIVMSLWLTLHGLVQHLLPSVESVPYGKNGVVMGMKYQGYGWFTI